MSRTLLNSSIEATLVLLRGGAIFRPVKEKDIRPGARLFVTLVVEATDFIIPWPARFEYNPIRGDNVYLYCQEWKGLCFVPIEQMLNPNFTTEIEDRLNVGCLCFLVLRTSRS